MVELRSSQTDGQDTSDNTDAWTRTISTRQWRGYVDTDGFAQSQRSSMTRSRTKSMDLDPLSRSESRRSSASSQSQYAAPYLYPKPRAASVVQNVVIPAHLMKHAETSWNKDEVITRRMSAFPRTDPRSKFDVGKMAQDQQSEVKSAARRVASIALEKSNSTPESYSSLSVPEPSYNQHRDHTRNIGTIADHTEAQEPVLSIVQSNGTSTRSRKDPRKRSVWRLGSTSIPEQGERRGTIFGRRGTIIQDTINDVREMVRKSSLWDVYESAKKRQIQIQRKRWVQIAFQYSFYFFCLAFIYFVLVGRPLWRGVVYEIYFIFKHKFSVTGSWSVVLGIAFLYAYTPLLILFEKDPPMPEDINQIDPTKTIGVADTALMIPCYKAATLIGPTLEAATKIFPPSHIFVVANGNSPVPLDNTEEICDKYGVNHVWSPVGSKIVAQFVGCYAAKEYKNVLLIDDDCALPPNFPIASERMKGKVKCLGYTIKSVGPKSSRGTLCQQAQDLEYKISGIQRALAGKVGSATFPHGAISLWDRDFLIETFNQHPGFSVSEDWFFGHVARELGCRTKMVTSVFIETETPDAFFSSSGGERGGFGEMTVFKQRFYRWNFFFVNGIYYNLVYILASWRLGWWELGAKLFVFQEIYETLLYLLTPFVLPISLVVNYQFTLELMAGTTLMYFVNVIIFNELHLRLKRERVGWTCLLVYYMPYKLIMSFVNVASCYYAIYKYATYFAKRHAKIIEDDKAINVVLQLEEAENEKSSKMGRRMTVTAIGAETEIATGPELFAPKFTLTTFVPMEASIEEHDKDSISSEGSGTAPDARRDSNAACGRKVSIATLGTKLPQSSPSMFNSYRRQSSYYNRTPSFVTPLEPDIEEEPDVAVFSGLATRVQAIEHELASRDIEVTDFALRENATKDSSRGEGKEKQAEDSRKTEDSKSIV